MKGYFLIEPQRNLPNTVKDVLLVLIEGAPNSPCRSRLIITKKDYYDCLVICTLREGEEIFKPKQEPLQELTTLEKMNKLMRDLDDKQTI